MRIELRDALEKATEIAEKASDIAKAHFRQALLIETKADQTPVTMADKKTEEFIRSELASSFSDHGVWGEEFGQDSIDKEYVWTIDPIDGTRSFIRGIPLFGTLLGLLHKMEPVLGVIVLPMLEETYAGAQGLGTYCNGHRLHCSTTSALENAVVSTGDIVCFETAGKTDYLARLIKTAQIVRGYTDCFGHSLLLRGAVDAMVDPMVSMWDIAPVACLVKESGGVYFDFENKSNLVEMKNFICSTPALKSALLKL